MKLLRYLLPLAGVAALVASPAVQAAPSFLGPTGDLLTPRNEVVPRGSFNAGLHLLLDVDELDDDELRIWKGNYGLSDRLEVGLTVFDQGGAREFRGKEVTINGKYLVFPADENGFALSVGVFDLTDELDLDPGFYVYASRDFSDLLGREVEPGEPGSLELGAGIGAGFYSGFFANGRVRLTRNLDVFAEFIDDAELLADGSMVNLGARLSVGRGLTLDGGLFDFGDWGVGITYSTARRGE